MGMIGKQWRIGIISTISVLLIVAACLALFAPARNWIRAYAREQQLKTKLSAINLPTGARQDSLVSSHAGNSPYVTGFYSADSNFESVKAHYRQELTRQGFASRIDHDSEGKEYVFFCAPGYAASLSPLSPAYGDATGYMLTLGTRETPC
jgi:hypothetical protein